MKPALLLISLVTASSLAWAVDTLQLGDIMPNVTLQDQHEKPATIDAQTQRIIFAADNTGASMVTAFLDSQAPSWLKDTRTTYLADIHKMPGFVTRMFALPQLREKPYTIILGREEADLAMMPRQKGCITISQLKEQKITTLDFACNEEDFQRKMK